MLADRIRMCSFKGKGELVDRTTPTVVVNQPYSTAGNGGRKSARLSNGWLVTVTYSAKKYYFRVSKNFGETWNQLCFIDSGASYMKDACNISIVSTGTRVYALYHNTGNNEYTYVATFDATTVGNVNVKSSIIIDIQTLIGNVSLDINKEGTELHACWSSKNSTYPNGFNIRYCKGIINGDGSITLSSVEQVNRETANNSLNPSIIIADNEPVIVYDYHVSNWAYIMCMKKVNGTFVRYNIYNPGSGYNQSNPSACVDRDNIIPVAWHGTDATHPSINYIRFSKSSDNGATWSVMKKLVPGEKPSLTTDKKGNYYIEYQDGIYVKRIQSSDKGETWSSPVTLDVSSNPSTLYDNKFELDFEVPLSIRQTSSSVIFSGKWYE